MEENKNSFGAIFGIFNKLSVQQKLLLGGIAVVSVILLAFSLWIFNEPSYSTLYTNLIEEDASKVLDHLNGQKIPFQIDNNGQTISIPKEKVYEVRLALAGKGIPRSGIIGNELFDDNTMGLSEFMQKVNFRRALEGELSRTIMQIRGIEGARVHIVFPEKTIFKKDKKEPTASVTLKLFSGNIPSDNHIQAISHLVSSSVEGLNPAKVVIIDTDGRMLSRNSDETSFAAVSGKQYEIKSGVENYLAEKAQSMLDNVLGYGNSIIKVNADLNFTQVEKEMKSIDPESQIIISEQTTKSESNGVSISDSNAVVSENSTTNYEISTSLERVVEGAGNIKRLTVAAVINGLPQNSAGDAGQEQTKVPRSEEQLRKLELIIKQAVGFDDSRNDKMSIESIPFETTMLVENHIEESSPFDDIGELSNIILIFIAIGASMFVIKGLMRRLKNEKIIIGSLGYQDQAFSDLVTTGSGGAAGRFFQVAGNKPKHALAVGDIEDEMTDEAAEKKMQQERIVNYVSKNPAEAAKLINSWLREDEF